MKLKLYNSLTRNKETFLPLDPHQVTMYACGPTVYNPPHIGNARAAVVYDLLFRVLKRHYSNVKYARNITDLDDKINVAAVEQDVSTDEIATRFTQAYHDDVGALGVLPPTIEPKATEHVGKMISMIERLIALGHAYEKKEHVLFHVPSFSDYGTLSGRARDEMIAGARVEVAPFKKDPADFVLWKPSPEGIPGWDSPWGWGRPGWHLECSAMIEQHLGDVIDIHGGGNDLKFPHHENELAQSRCVHGNQMLARYWIHNGFVEIEQEKMSKSTGNVLLVRDLLNKYPGEAIRLALIKTRYREPLNWSEQILVQAKSQLDRIYGALEKTSHVPIATEELIPDASFCDAMDDDLNVPLALTRLMEIVGEINRGGNSASELRALKHALLGGGQELGLLMMSSADWFRGERGEKLSAQHIEEQIQKRIEARALKDWGAADKIRDDLLSAGVRLEDSPQGVSWRYE